MIRLYCTKKLQDFLGNVENTLPEDFKELSSSDWNANLFSVDRRKCLILINNLTHYSIFLSDIFKEDFSRINHIFKVRLKEQLVHDKILINSDSIEKVFPGSELKFYKTNNNKKIIGRMNDFLYTFKYRVQYGYNHLNEVNLSFENGIINQTPIKIIKNDKKVWTTPNKLVLELKIPINCS